VTKCTLKSYLEKAVFYFVQVAKNFSVFEKKLFLGAFVTKISLHFLIYAKRQIFLQAWWLHSINNFLSYIVKFFGFCAP
jgi:hypothetical protein